jgi:hypothetical protein
VMLASTQETVLLKEINGSTLIHAATSLQG